jgi:prepilin-type N-terminal cleavage/methylation domain-containing protein
MEGKMKFHKSGQKGFTLIELLVVIAILGTLAGVVVLNVIGFIGSGKCQAAKTELHNVQTAVVASTYAASIGNSLASYTDYLLTSMTGTYSGTGNGEQTVQLTYQDLDAAGLAACP